MGVVLPAHAACAFLGGEGANMSVGRCWRNRVATGLLVVACAGAVGRAEEKPARAPSPLERKVERMPASTATFALFKLPAGKITIRDKDGKVTEVEIKPVWIGETEVTWDEYEVFY